MGAIALGPMGNAQGDHHFMSLFSGARISRHQWTELPIPDTAIARVQALGLEDKQPLIQERGLVVERRTNHPIDESEYDRDYVLPRVAPVDVFGPNDFDPIDADEAADLTHDTAVHGFIDAPHADPIALDQGAPEQQHRHHADHQFFYDDAQPAIVVDDFFYDDAPNGADVFVFDDDVEDKDTSPANEEAHTRRRGWS
jgi:hypothetical protein